MQYLTIPSNFRLFPAKFCDNCIHPNKLVCLPSKPLSFFWTDPNFCELLNLFIGVSLCNRATMKSNGLSCSTRNTSRLVPSSTLRKRHHSRGLSRSSRKKPRQAKREDEEHRSSHSLRSLGRSNSTFAAVDNDECSQGSLFDDAAHDSVQSTGRRDAFKSDTTFVPLHRGDERYSGGPSEGSSEDDSNKSIDPT